MKIGISLLLWTTHATAADLAPLPRIRAAGFDGVEVPISRGDPAHYRWLRTALGDEGLGATVLGFLPDAAHNPVADDPAARRRALDHLRWLVDCAEALGAEVLGGPLHQPLGQFTGFGPTETERERLVAAHRAMLDHAAGTSLVIAVEPVNRYEAYMLTTCADAAAHVAAVGHPDFGYTYDSFHVNIEEADPIGVPTQTGAALRHVHLSENDRGVPGRGHIDLAGALRAMKAAGYGGWVTVEALSRAVTDLAAPARIWRDLAEDEDALMRESIALIRSAWAEGGRA